MYCFVCVFVSFDDPILFHLAHLVLLTIGPQELALCSNQPQRIQKSQLSQHLMICDNPKWQFPMNPRLPFPQRHVLLSHKVSLQHSQGCHSMEPTSDSLSQVDFMS